MLPHRFYSSTLVDKEPKKDTKGNLPIMPLVIFIFLLSYNISYLSAASIFVRFLSMIEK